MLRRIVLSAAAAVLLAAPAPALAAKKHHYAVGQKCSTKDQKAYKAAHLKCVKGHLVKLAAKKK